RYRHAVSSNRPEAGLRVGVGPHASGRGWGPARDKKCQPSPPEDPIAQTRARRHRAPNPEPRAPDLLEHEPPAEAHAALAAGRAGDLPERVASRDAVPGVRVAPAHRVGRVVGIDPEL